MALRKNLSFLILLGIVMLFLFIPTGMTFAALDDLPEFSGPIVPTCGIGNNVGPFSCGACDLIKLAQNIVKFFVFFATVIAVLMFVYAGFLYISSVGDPGKIKKAHGIFINVFWGFIIVLAAWLLINFIMVTFGVDKKLKDEFRLKPWKTIICNQGLPPPIAPGTPS